MACLAPINIKSAASTPVVEEILIEADWFE